jgi:hypothetical protein
MGDPGATLTPALTRVYRDVRGAITGYTVMSGKPRRERPAHLEWIWAPGAGRAVLAHTLKYLREAGASRLDLQVSLDPNEKKATVLRRLNFYISHGFKATDVKFRGDAGSLLSMTLLL